MTGDLAGTIATAVREAHEARNGLAVAGALNCIEPSELAPFFHVSLAGDVDADPIGEGLPASPGAASGRIVLSADDAIAAAETGDDVILVRTRDVARRRARHAGLAGHPDEPRGHGQPRSGGRPRLGHPRRRRGRRRPHRWIDRGHRVEHTPGRRRDHHRRQHRRRVPRSTGDRWSCSPTRTRRAVGVGRHPSPTDTSRSGPTPTPPATRATGATSVPRGSGCAAPSTCSSPPNGCR